MWRTKDSILSRLWFLYGAVFLVAAILIFQLFLIQIVNGEEFSAKADRQYVTSSTAMFDRGSILFTEKNGKPFNAAKLAYGFTIAIKPSVLTNSSDAFEKLSEIIPLESDTFFIKASKKKDPYEEIARRVSEKDAEKIKSLDIDGVTIVKERWRYYPGGDTASHLLGFVGYRGSTLSGIYGLEQYYNDILSRKKNNLYVNFFAEAFINMEDGVFNKHKEREGNLVTSIEPSVQVTLENVLKEIEKEWKSDAVGGIIINPINGEIYGLANIPNFDPNYFNIENDSSVFPNPIVESVFEMGSIIKPLTMAAGLDAGVITAETKYEDKGYVEFDGRRIENYDGKARGVVPMQEILNQSLNTGAVFVMQKLGKERFREYMTSFEIGEETGIDLPNEVMGLVDNLNSKRDIEYATASFGQGIAMTPIATTRALSVIANGGVLVTPHIVKNIDYVLGSSLSIVPTDTKRVLKSETSEEITRMLVNVVDNALLGGTVKLPRYSIAAKTGTAQIALESGRGYYDDKYLHSFFGYFPAYEPRFLVFLYTINPKGARYASQTLTYPFMNITKFLLNYYEVPPDR